MSDTVDRATRTRIMRAVKAKNTQPEMRVRAILRAHGFRYRLHGDDLPGKPDILLRTRKLAIFVHGCFWHGHDCARGARLPKANNEYWRAKIARNVTRDAKARKALKAAGWRVLVVWECALKNEDALARRLNAFMRAR
jgi:DNA mismatch endonuclease (patch repair protein)